MIKVNDSNSRILISNISYSSLLKIATVGLSYLIIPLLIGYLSSVEYGIWITILSIVNWFNLFDLGLGNGLKNKLTEFISNSNIALAKSYVTTTYFLMGITCIGIGILTSFISLFIPWHRVFNINEDLNSSVSWALAITLFFTLVNMVLRLINNVLHAYQKSFRVDIINFFSQLMIFLVLIVVKSYFQSSLVVIAISFSLIQFLVLVISTIYLFYFSYHDIAPQKAFLDKALYGEIYKIGGGFFLIQIAGVIMYMTDNFVIASLFGPEKVTEYTVAYKYYTVLTVGWTLILSPLWSLTTRAYFSGELTWIKKMMNKLVFLWLISIIVGFIMYVFSDYFYSFWIGETVKVSQSINRFVLLYICVSMFATIIATFINGIGKIKMQIYLTMGTAILNIPLAIIFAKYLGLGVVGVPLATSICLFLTSCLAYIQCNLILNKKSTGIWNE